MESRDGDRSRDRHFELNPTLGDTAPVVVPYDPSFNRLKAHHCGLYFGASIAALKLLEEQKGYVFVGTGSSGVNSFFVRSDVAPTVIDLIWHFVAFPARHRDSRNEMGQLTFVSGTRRAELIAGCIVQNIQTGAKSRFGDIAQPYSKAWLVLMKC